MESVREGLPGSTASVRVEGDEVRVHNRVSRVLVYRCTAELVRNALTHAEARDVTVRLARGGGDGGEGIELVVVDNGRGFDPDEAAPGHHGLRLIASAVAGAGGSLAVNSGAGGTTVSIAVPDQA